MLQLRSVVEVADNTGAKYVHVIGIPGKGNLKVARIGDCVRAVVKKAAPNGSVTEHEKVIAVVVRTKKETRRSDGSAIRFDNNAVVILDNVADKKPKGTRVFGPIAREIKEYGFNKIASMAKEVY
jgi:large subunit ribosomal protein L14